MLFKLALNISFYSNLLNLISAKVLQLIVKVAIVNLNNKYNNKAKI